MNALHYLTRTDLSSDEECLLWQELSSAYAMDEAAVSSEKVRHLLERLNAELSAARPTGTEGGEGLDSEAQGE